LLSAFSAAIDKGLRVSMSKATAIHVAVRVFFMRVLLFS
jgi:hypothetical protein